MVDPNYWCLEKKRMAKHSFPQFLNNPVGTCFNSVLYGIFLAMDFLPNYGLCLADIKWIGLFWVYANDWWHRDSLPYMPIAEKHLTDAQDWELKAVTVWEVAELANGEWPLMPGALCQKDITISRKSQEHKANNLLWSLIGLLTIHVANECCNVL